MNIADLALKEEISKDYRNFLPILKALANEKRMVTLIYLLNGPTSFQKLLSIVNLQKTALSNHLSHLLESQLIHKVNYGIYEITPDGRDFLRAIWGTWLDSRVAQDKKVETMDLRKNSSLFLQSYFRSSK